MRSGSSAILPPMVSSEVSRYVRARLSRDPEGRRILRSLNLAASFPEIVAFDPHTNFGYSTVQAGSTIIGSAISPKTIVLFPGDGASYPGGDGTTQFNVVLWPSAARALRANSEVIRVTRVGDVLTTVARAQEGTAALSVIAAGYQVMVAVTSKTLTDIELVAPSEILTVAAFNALSPIDKQNVIIEIDATNGIYWRFRYRAAAAGLKWEFQGGPALYSEVTTQESLPADSSTAYRALATAGPSILLPFNTGDYAVDIGASMAAGDNGGGGGDDFFMSYDIGGTGAVDADSTDAINNLGNPRPAMRRRGKTGLTAVTLTAKYRHTAGATASGGSAKQRWMSVLPVRVSQ